jgi:hypothetical protein
MRADVEPVPGARPVRMRIALRGSSGISKRLRRTGQKMTSIARTASQAAS